MRLKPHDRLIGRRKKSCEVNGPIYMSESKRKALAILAVLAFLGISTLLALYGLKPVQNALIGGVIATIPAGLSFVGLNTLKSWKKLWLQLLSLSCFVVCLMIEREISKRAELKWIVYLCYFLTFFFCMILSALFVDNFFVNRTARVER